MTHAGGRFLVVTVLLSAVTSAVVATALALVAPEPAVPPVVIRGEPGEQPILKRLDRQHEQLAGLAQELAELARARVTVPELDRERVLEGDELPSVDVGSVERVVDRLEAIVGRLEKLELDHGYSRMVEAMAELPRNAPVDHGALARLIAGGSSAERELMHLRAAEIVNRFGSPEHQSFDRETETINWRYRHPRGNGKRWKIKIRFRAGRVIWAATF